MKPPCPCGKRAWTSQGEADRIVVEAKIRAGLYGNHRRREQRAYACPIRTGLWHITSQTGPGVDLPPLLPDYPNTDDEAAADLISDALRVQHDATWTALLADDRVEQTSRVLVTLHQNLTAQGQERAARVTAVQSRRTVGEASDADVERARAELADWQARVAHFRAAVQSRMDHAKQAVKALNVARSEARNSRENIAHREALRRLTLAVTRHLTCTDQPTPADRELWAWLTVLAVPYEDRTASLADMVAGRHWADTDELRRTA